VQAVAVDTRVVDCAHVPLETFAYGPPDDVLRRTRYPPCAGNPDDAPQLRDKLVAAGFEAVPAPGVLSVTAWARPVPETDVVV
jgi:hypothetical protein